MNFKTTLSAFICLSALLSAAPVLAQKQNIAFTEDNWILIAGAKIVGIDGRSALQLGDSAAQTFFGAAVLKGMALENGTIEFDTKFTGARTFAGVQFRLESQGNSEDFYMRGHHSGEPDANQYMTNYNGIPSWQLYYGAPYSVQMEYPMNEWFHVKLVIQDGMADMYIADQNQPALTVALKRDQATGGVAFWGLDFGAPALYSNFSIDAESNEKIVGTAAAEPAAAAGTIMNWHVSNAVDGAVLSDAQELSDAFMASLKFTKMAVESRGILNLAKLQGVAKGADTALAKFTITSDVDQLKALEFGFSDDVTVYLNGTPIFSGSDRFLSRDYRFLGTVGYNDMAWLSLNKGENTVILAVTESVEDTTGWAVQGRITDMSGILIK